MSPSFQPLGSKITHSGSLLEDMDPSPSGAGSRGMTGFSARGTQLSRLSSWHW